MPSLVKCSGLHTNHNELNVPEGALAVADNVNVDQNDTLTPRRGFKQYGDDFPVTTDRAKQLMSYKDRIIRHYGSSLQYDSDGAGTFSAFNGTYSELETGLRIKYFESNSNFYFTTNDGIKKISATSASDFSTSSGFIVGAGVPKGLDLQLTLDYISSGFFTADNQVAYRVVWGYTDLNNNLLLGSPSDRVTITNDATHSYTSITDNGSGKCRFTDTAHGLETGDIITVTGCTETEYNTTHTVTRISADVFDTDVDIAELSDAISFANECKAAYNAHIADGAEHFQGGGATPDSTNTIVAADATNYATLITLVTELVSATTSYDAHNQDLIDGGPVFHNAHVAGATAYDLISTTAPTSLAEAITDLNDFNTKYEAHDADAVGHTVGGQHPITTASTPTITTATDGTWSYVCQVSTTFTIPSDCNSTDYFYQIYRTGLSGSESTDPGDEMFLVYEENLTSTDISNGYVTVSNENYPESFRENATPLYTNEITGDGILQSNDRPPVAKDVTVFRESAFYANTKTLQRITLTLTGVDDFVAGTTKVIIANDESVTIYNGESAENVGSKNFKVFTAGTAAQNIRDTAQSLIHVINRDSNRIVNAYYGSGTEDLPGIIEFEGVSLDDTYIDFGVVSSVGDSFNPTISETVALTAASQASPTQITATGHNYATGDKIYVYCSDSTPAINNVYTITKVDANNFTIPLEVTVAGTSGYVFKQKVYSDNEVAANRLYFSKTSQPEAVPITNWIDIGAKDSSIKRVIALRDNLYVLKEDGVYIVSGTTAPNFSSRILDNSVNFQASDTAVVLNNQIYALTNQGVVTISDGGVGVISRPIEDLILGVTNSNYSNYNIYSFGISYESDRAYHIWLPTLTSDTYATQCYRYNTFNRTWTRWVKNATCGVINPNDDKMYLGIGDDDFILRERKDYKRSDYADLEYSNGITLDGISSTYMQLNSISNVDIGDSIVQTQYVTIVKFNRLLKKLDTDPGLDDTDYYSTLALSVGKSPYTAVENLMTKLDSDDSGKTYTYDNPTTFSTLRTTYNTIITNLNHVDSDSFFGNYSSLSSTGIVYEAVVTGKNISTTSALLTQAYSVQVSVAMPFLFGEVVIHDGYEKKIDWVPQHFGDPSIGKQVRRGTVLFDGNTFTNATLAFASDLSPSFTDIDFSGAGTGTFGTNSFGNSVWGGDGTDKPFNTLVPRQKQRCRYISSRFKHVNAREKFVVVGITYSMRHYSDRLYRQV